MLLEDLKLKNLLYYVINYEKIPSVKARHMKKQDIISILKQKGITSRKIIDDLNYENFNRN